MFAPSHFHTHYFDDDGCSTDEFIDAEVKVDLQHVEFKGLRLSSLPPPLHRHLGSDPMSIVDPMLEEDGDQMLEDSVDLADYAYATGFEGGGLVGATNNIEVLPNEVFVLIFSYLDSRELLTVASTCHRWRHLAEGTLLSLLVWLKLDCSTHFHGLLFQQQRRLCGSRRWCAVAARTARPTPSSSTTLPSWPVRAHHATSSPLTPIAS